MSARSKNKMGRFSVDFEIANNNDLAVAERGFLDPAQIRRKIVRGVVDPGAARLVLPSALAKELGLPLRSTKARVRYADGRRALRPEVDGVYLRLQGRYGVYTAVLEPKRDTALIGAFVLEDLDFLVDCAKQRLVPRDPDHIVNEIE